MPTFSDIAAVEYRVAQLAGTGRTPVGGARANADTFGALLNAAQPSPGSVAPRPAAPCIVPQPALERLIAHACAQNGADPALIKAVVANESAFDASATSGVGAQGLMQLMPTTAAGLGVSDAYDPAQNIAGGTKYLSGLLRHFGGNLPLALAAYNAGPGAVERGRIGKETTDYVRSVLASYASYSGAQRP